MTLRNFPLMDLMHHHAVFCAHIHAPTEHGETEMEAGKGAD